MYNTIMKVLKKYFTNLNDYKLGEIAREIENNIKMESIPTKSCISCIYYPMLMTTFIGQEPPNLCQKGRVRGDAINCPYYYENTLRNKHNDITKNTIGDYTWKL